jgi:two-component system sensor histidine kinase PilS (NtrC family)
VRRTTGAESPGGRAARQRGDAADAGSARSDGAGQARADRADPPEPGFDALPSYRRSLQSFALARLVVAAVLLGYPPVMQGLGGLDAHFEAGLFVPAAVGYLAVAVAFVAAAALARVPLRALAVSQVAFDVAMLAVLLHAAGGLRSDLAILMLLPAAGAAALLGVRVGLFFAALAAIVLLLETGWRGLRQEAGDGAIVQAGLVGAALLATAAIVGWLAARLAAQERVSSRHREDLRNQLAVTQAVIGDLREGIVVLDAFGMPRAINRSAREMLGDATTDSQGTPAPAVVALQAALGLVDGASPVESGELIVPGVDGGASRRLRARRIGVPAGGSDRVVVLEDLGRLEALAQQMKLASMGRLSASIAHEIRNPLSAIRHANGLLSEQSGTPPLRRLASIVEDNCLRIDRVIEDVLSIARGVPATPEPIAAGPFLARTVGELVAQSGVDAGRIEWRIRGDVPIWFDAGHLRRVLLNLLGNALRHASGARGAVLLEWGADASGRGALVVADDGPGVSPAARAHLFEPFFTTEARGTGLGLHLARELCTANGASIRYRPACDDPPLRGAFIVEPAPAPASTR